MQSAKVSGILVENHEVYSEFLQRQMIVDLFLPTNVSDPSSISLLLINDGQNLEEMALQSILSGLYVENSISPLLCVGIHADRNRKREYGVSEQPDYLGRGDQAAAFTNFVLEELIPFVRRTYAVDQFREKAYLGFSLGGLMALDIVWNHADQFSKAGIFSGSLWWRSLDQEDKEYNDDKHRIMHQVIRNGEYKPGLKFFFQCGNMDETMDRNQNGIIDSIDDTLDLIKELESKGYDKAKDIHYLEMPDGRHDIPTWSKALPEFLKWGWGL